MYSKREIICTDCQLLLRQPNQKVNMGVLCSGLTRDKECLGTSLK
jgi:hypothetical protein